MNAKERFVAEVRLKGIELSDKEATRIMILFLSGLAGLATLLYSHGVFESDMQVPAMMFLVGGILTLIWLDLQIGKHIRDSYEWLVASVKSGTLLSSTPPELRVLETIWYRPHYYIKK